MIATKNLRVRYQGRTEHIHAGITRIAPDHPWATEHADAFGPESGGSAVPSRRAYIGTDLEVAEEQGRPRAARLAELDDVVDRRIVDERERRERWWRSIERLISSIAPRETAEERKLERLCDIEHVLDEKKQAEVAGIGSWI